MIDPSKMTPEEYATNVRVDQGVRAKHGPGNDSLIIFRGRTNPTIAGYEHAGDGPHIVHEKPLTKPVQAGEVSPATAPETPIVMPGLPGGTNGPDRHKRPRHGKKTTKRRRFAVGLLGATAVAATMGVTAHALENRGHRAPVESQDAHAATPVTAAPPTTASDPIVVTEPSTVEPQAAPTPTTDHRVDPAPTTTPSTEARDAVITPTTVVTTTTVAETTTVPSRESVELQRRLGETPVVPMPTDTSTTTTTPPRRDG